VKYNVTITEILKRVVIIEADNGYDAEEIAQNRWNDEKYILTADDFVEANFSAEEV
jgi:hypothetical protein